MSRSKPLWHDRTLPAASRIEASPFLRWAGGKQHLLAKIVTYLPNNVRRRRYYEPFAGAASMFLAVAPESGVVSDVNELLISCYSYVRDYPDLVADYLTEHRRKNGSDYYYRIRDIFNSTGVRSAAQAARFIYLNKACFNGIYRVNQCGAFNVPYGHKEPPAIPSRETLRRAAQALTRIELRVAHFLDATRDAGKGDFVYLDPPYPPLNGTSYFTHYTPDRFGWDDHVALAKHVRALVSRGCLVMVTNADLPKVRRLFAGYHIRKLRVTRYVTCRSVKHQVGELVVTTYPAGDNI
jgi:DNA adenine methylase